MSSTSTTDAIVVGGGKMLQRKYNEGYEREKWVMVRAGLLEPRASEQRWGHSAVARGFSASAPERLWAWSLLRGLFWAQSAVGQHLWPPPTRCQ